MNLIPTINFDDSLPQIVASSPWMVERTQLKYYPIDAIVQPTIDLDQQVVSADNSRQYMVPGVATLPYVTVSATSNKAINSSQNKTKFSIDSLIPRIVAQQPHVFTQRTVPQQTIPVVSASPIDLSVIPTTFTAPLKSIIPIIQPVVQPTITPIIQPIVQSVKPVVQPTITPIIQPIVQSVKPVVQQIVLPVKPVVQQIVQPVKPVVQQIVQPVKPVVQQIVQPALQIAQPTPQPVVTNTLELITFNMNGGECKNFDQINLSAYNPELVFTQQDSNAAIQGFDRKHSHGTTNKVGVLVSPSSLHENINYIDIHVPQSGNLSELNAVIAAYRDIKIASVYMGEEQYTVFTLKDFTSVMNRKMELIDEVLKQNPDIVMGDFGSPYYDDAKKLSKIITNQAEMTLNKKYDKTNKADKAVRKNIEDLNTRLFDKLNFYSYANPINIDNLTTNSVQRNVTDLVWYKSDRLTLQECKIIQIMKQNLQQCDGSTHNPIYVKLEIKTENKRKRLVPLPTTRDVIKNFIADMRSFKFVDVDVNDFLKNGAFHPSDITKANTVMTMYSDLDKFDNLYCVNTFLSLQIKFADNQMSTKAKVLDIDLDKLKELCQEVQKILVVYRQDHKADKPFVLNKTSLDAIPIYKKVQKFLLDLLDKHTSAVQPAIQPIAIQPATIQPATIQPAAIQSAIQPVVQPAIQPVVQPAIQPAALDKLIKSDPNAFVMDEFLKQIKTFNLLQIKSSDVITFDIAQKIYDDIQKFISLYCPRDPVTGKFSKILDGGFFTQNINDPDVGMMSKADILGIEMNDVKNIFDKINTVSQPTKDKYDDIKPVLLYYVNMVDFLRNVESFATDQLNDLLKSGGGVDHKFTQITQADIDRASLLGKNHPKSNLRKLYF